ncbi:MAG: 16S rRNA (adenine(1518)-N(6)/adenine(1519)-N(6))-dimethyltransferase RsmA [Candidatus Omnitrophota bacterium]
MLTKNELKALWQKTGFRPLKRLGQNFLVDKNVKDKILRNVEIGPDDTVLEIGPGFGEMTFGLAERAKKVFAVEKDKKVVKILKTGLKLPGNAVLIEDDFLDVDIKKLAANKKVIVYGNLPYYITSPILEKLFSNISLIKSIYFVVQKEVADRILAKPGSKDIGRLSLYVQYYTEPKRIFTIGKGCFYPAPGVESAFLKLIVLRKKKARVKDEKLFFEIIKNAYGQRRKTLLNSLSGMGIEKGVLSRSLKAAGINPRSRAEELSLQDFALLSGVFPK